MLIRALSDLHTEFWNYNNFHRTLARNLPPLETDPETVLVLAGDNGTFHYYKSTFKPLLRLLAKRFRYVLLTYGNHEYYHSSVWGSEAAFWADKDLPENVTILTDDYKIIDDVVFIGATLWTDFAGQDELAMRTAERGMNDYHVIRAGRYLPDADKWVLRTMPPLRPAQTVVRHEVSKQFIFDACKMFRYQKRVVITHHAPSWRSVHPKYLQDLLTAAFCSELDELIELYGPDLWVHGHMHDNVDYMIGSTRVLCNPFGYVMNGRKENKGYNPILTLEL